MIEVLSHGNRIRRGAYVLHSSFDSAVNFVSGNDFVFLVKDHIGAGACTIVLRGAKMSSLRTLIIEENGFTLNEERCPLDPAVQYHPKLEPFAFNRNRFDRNIHYFTAALLDHAPEKSLAFLLDEKRCGEFVTPFDLEYRNRAAVAVRKLLSDDFLEGVRSLKGMGPGLTPAGDDFNAGILLAVNFLQIAYGIDYTNLIGDVFAAAKGDNLFSNAMLWCAAEGLFFEKFKRLAVALVAAGEEKVVRDAKELMAVGATSGADEAVGFLFGIKRF